MIKQTSSEVRTETITGPVVDSSSPQKQQQQLLQGFEEDF